MTSYSTFLKEPTDPNGSSTGTVRYFMVRPWSFCVILYILLTIFLFISGSNRRGTNIFCDTKLLASANTSGRDRGWGYHSGQPVSSVPTAQVGAGLNNGREQFWHQSIH